MRIICKANDIIYLFCTHVLDLKRDYVHYSYSTAFFKLKIIHSIFSYFVTL